MMMIFAVLYAMLLGQWRQKGMDFHVRELQMGTISMMMNVKTAFSIIGKHAGHLVILKTLTGEHSAGISD